MEYTIKGPDFLKTKHFKFKSENDYPALIKNAARHSKCKHNILIKNLREIIANEIYMDMINHLMETYPIKTNINHIKNTYTSDIAIIKIFPDAIHLSLNPNLNYNPKDITHENRIENLNKSLNDMELWTPPDSSFFTFQSVRITDYEYLILCLEALQLYSNYIYKEIDYTRHDLKKAIKASDTEIITFIKNIHHYINKMIYKNIQKR